MDEETIPVKFINGAVMFTVDPEILWTLDPKVPTFNDPEESNDPPVIAFVAVIVFDDAMDPLVILPHVNEPEISILPFWLNVILSDKPLLILKSDVNLE